MVWLSGYLQHMFNEGRKEVPDEDYGAQGCWYGLNGGGGVSAVFTQVGKV